MSIPCQETTISANAITISKDTILESVMPPARDMRVDPISLDTTTMGIADTLPIYHADDNELLEGNPFTSDAKDELITLPSTSSNCGLRSLYANAVLEAEAAPTPNLLQNNLSTTPMDSVSDSNVPETKSLLSTSKLLPDFLKESIEPR